MEIACERGVAPAQIAMAWLLGKPAITSPIFGATKASHLDGAVAAVALNLTAEEVARLEEPYRPHPATDGYSMRLRLDRIGGATLEPGACYVALSRSHLRRRDDTPTRGVMTRLALFSLALALASATAFAQPLLPPGASPQSAQDPGYQALIATCKVPPPAPAARGGGPGRGGPAGAAPAATTFPLPPAAYTVAAIPGVIAAGQQWTKVWETDGNNADGILADTDGGMLIAQNHNSRVVKLNDAGQVTTVFSDTHTGGALSKNKKGELFMVQRGLRANVSQMSPTRRILADKLPNGDPLDCLGGVINDLTADSRGGAYFTMGGLFYADPKGVVTRYGEGLQTNGIVLSPDEKTLYVTNAGKVAAFDVQGDGSLTNQRQFVELPTPGGDGLAVDNEGRLYVTAGPNVHVVAADGKLLGSIPAPYGLITAAFGGKDKRTMYAVVSLQDPTRLQHAYVYRIPMLAQGYAGRAK
jgi:gluconolactonase